jgi:tricorn protease-like protein
LNADGAELAFNRDGKYLVSSDQLGAINIWDISVMAASEKTVQFNGIVENVQFSPSGDRLATSDENRVWLLDPEPLSDLTVNLKGTPTLTFKSKVKDVIFSPDSKFLGILTEGNEVAYYNVGSRSLRIFNVSSLIRSIAFSPDSQQFITSDVDGSLQAWNVSTAQLIDQPDEKYTQAFSFATSPELLAIGSKDKITVINGDGALPEIESRGENTLLVFSADGSSLASTDTSGQINIWKDQDGEFTAVSSAVKEQATSLSFNPEGTLLAVGTAKNLYLINSNTGEEIARIPHIDIVNGVSFSVDGNILATASSKVLQFWNIANIQQIEKETLAPTACSRLVENFDTTQWHALFGDQEYRTLCENLPMPQ